jgi:hypothetical protein
MAQPIPNAPATPTYAIVWDLHAPSMKYGGISDLLNAAGHAQAGHGHSWYYLQLNNRLMELGCNNHNEQYSFCANANKTSAHVNIEASLLQTHPTLTWMSVPGIVRRLHVVQVHTESFY